MNAATLHAPPVAASRNAITESLSSYDVQQASLVHEFLADRPTVVQLLPDVLKNARRYFGQDTSVSLKLVSLPEGGANSIILYAMIRTDKSVDDSLRCLEELDRGWWMDASYNVIGELVVSVESA